MLTQQNQKTQFIKSILLVVFVLFGCQLMATSNKNESGSNKGIAEFVVNLAGFKYDYTQNIYVSRHHALQRFLGYNWIYDECSAPLGMVIDTEPIRFNCNGKRYMIEMWKGQYYAATGCEVGLYVGTGIGKNDKEIFRCANDSEAIPMQYSLYRNNELLFSRVDNSSWWLTGFKPGIFSNPNQLVMKDIHLEFKIPGMAKAFYNALLKTGYTPSTDNVFLGQNNDITFTFSTPKTKQPQSQKFRNDILKLTKKSVDLLNEIKTKFNMKDFSPQSIDKLLTNIFQQQSSELNDYKLELNQNNVGVLKYMKNLTPQIFNQLLNEILNIQDNQSTDTNL